MIFPSNISNPPYIREGAGASSAPMTRQEEEDAVEPIAGARGSALSVGWESPLCLQRRLWRDMEKVDD